jgi:oxaloacetate decarboxylase alpha subunit
MVQLHCHYIGGLAIGAYIKAAEAGVDIIDTASLPLAFGASQPPVETIVKCLQGSDINTGIDLRRLFAVADFIEELRKLRGFERGVTGIAYMRVFEHQIPGGMISNFMAQLEQQKASHRINEVLEEIPRVREDLGYPPLVTPTSQIVGTQAVLNVLSGERYKMVPDEVKSYVAGHYGLPPGKVNPEIQKMIIGDAQPLTVRSADILEPGLAGVQKECAGLACSPEDVISYALFPQVARRFFEDRQNRRLGVAFEIPDVIPEQKDPAAPRRMPPKTTPLEKRVQTLSEKEDREMNLQEIKELIKLLDNTDINELDLESEGMKISIRKGRSAVSAAVNSTAPVVAPAGAENEKAKASPGTTPSALEPAAFIERESNRNYKFIKSPMVGTFYTSAGPDSAPFIEVGQQVKAGQTVCIIEAMKLMNEIESEFDGRIVEVLVENAQPVEFGQPLFAVAT